MIARQYLAEMCDRRSSFALTMTNTCSEFLRKAGDVDFNHTTSHDDPNMLSTYSKSTYTSTISSLGMTTHDDPNMYINKHKIIEKKIRQ